MCIHIRMARIQAQVQRSWGDEFRLRLVLVMLCPLKSLLRLGATFWLRLSGAGPLGLVWLGLPPGIASLLSWSGCVLPRLPFGICSALVSLRLFRGGRCLVCTACDLHLFRLRSSRCVARTYMHITIMVFHNGFMQSRISVCLFALVYSYLFCSFWLCSINF